MKRYILSFLFMYAILHGEAIVDSNQTAKTYENNISIITDTYYYKGKLIPLTRVLDNNETNITQSKKCVKSTSLNCQISPKYLVQQRKSMKMNQSNTLSPHLSKS